MAERETNELTLVFLCFQTTSRSLAGAMLVRPRSKLHGAADAHAVEDDRAADTGQ